MKFNLYQDLAVGNKTHVAQWKRVGLEIGRSRVRVPLRVESDISNLIQTGCGQMEQRDR